MALLKNFIMNVVMMHQAIKEAVLEMMKGKVSVSSNVLG